MVAIVVALAIALGVYFGVFHGENNTNTASDPLKSFLTQINETIQAS